MKKSVIAAASLTILVFSVVGQCNAQSGVATQANLEKVRPGRLSEAQVKAILGEPKKVETEMKSKHGGREIDEIAIFHYEIGGKDVRVYINRTWGYSTSVKED
ncbi:MAG: hypothetical protein WCD80_02765 [Desulfobaccales bacterium]